MSRASVMGLDGRAVIVAVDHPLYSWPCRGLEDRFALIRQVGEAGADGIIASYGTIRDAEGAFGRAAPILKLDLTTVTLGGGYPVSEYVLAWTLHDAMRLRVKAVLTFVQLGASFELEALRAAGHIAAECDREGLTYVCEIMPVESERFPDAAAPEAIAAACRTGAELGAHIIKTTMPTPPEAIAEAAGCGIPIITAGGAMASDRTQLLTDIRTSMNNGAAGVAFGRNVWGSDDPSGMVASLCGIVHGSAHKQ
jgi:DhnA family fructose-bisphosphate aldolase class Ia